MKTLLWAYPYNHSSNRWHAYRDRGDTVALCGSTLAPVMQNAVTERPGSHCACRKCEKILDSMPTPKAQPKAKPRQKRPPEHCPDSPTGQHTFSPDVEYDLSGKTINCEHCGKDASPHDRVKVRRKLDQSKLCP